MAPKVVVITGCSSGIGLETAVLLASDKLNRFKVFATMRNLGKQAKLKMAAGSALDQTLFIRQLDVAKEDSISDFFDKINREEGGVDILINNAGIGQVGAVEKVAMSTIKTIFETNVFGLIQMTQAVIPGMKVKRAGHIINISSMGGLFGFPFGDIYSSSKFAVEGFSESIAPLLKKFNIRVSVIEPGPVKTEIMANIKNNKTGNFDDSRITKNMTSMMQNPQKGVDIALIIRDAILSENPHLHYATTEAMGKFAATKYVDPTGDSVVHRLQIQSKL